MDGTRFHLDGTVLEIAFSFWNLPFAFQKVVLILECNFLSEDCIPISENRLGFRILRSSFRMSFAFRNLSLIFRRWFQFRNKVSLSGNLLYFRRSHWYLRNADHISECGLHLEIVVDIMCHRTHLAEDDKSLYGTVLPEPYISM